MTEDVMDGVSTAEEKFSPSPDLQNVAASEGEAEAALEA